MPASASARVRASVLLAVGVALAGGGLTGLAPGQATASSHREAPLISGQPQYDNTDVYAFVSPDRPDSTTLIADWIPFEDPSGGPNFYKFATDARYDINVDSDGNAQADYTFRWTFTDRYRSGDTFLYNTGPVKSLSDPNLNFLQTYDLTLIKRSNGTAVSEQRLATNVPVAPSNVGKASMPDYASLRQQAVHPLTGGPGGWANGGQVFAGQADDPFFLDLRVFDLLYGGNLSEVGNDTLRGYNVNSVALQVPTKMLSAGSHIIGVWSDTQRRGASGWYTQVSRLGMPLVNEVVIPLKDKDRFNASVPWNNARFGRYVTDPELPRLIQKVYGIPAPAAPRKDLVQVFLTGVPGLNQPPNVRPAEMLRLNTSIPPAKRPDRLGVLAGDKAGFPNGRRLGDDVVDASLQVVEGRLLGAKTNLGDGVDANDQAFGTSFPYLALPSSGSSVKNASVKGSSAGGTATGGNPTGRVTPLNAGPVADKEPVRGSSPLLPIAAIGAGALFLGGSGALWWRRRRPSRSL
ncbi:DUF4331 domain-containing protein [Actinoallomurus spadix]|uniref:DUF4331 domain-containing protein n=1 Tax=Actinoallomurus spadix TaxID=79912 RepID=A0ABN0VVR9_9ACTN|nr:DUF4331 domain-containing protein [Actinoallomurus spadix]MCO5985831.1 DUF4331 domain-containing protein [Actinoallomurus spadix]